MVRRKRKFQNGPNPAKGCVWRTPPPNSIVPKRLLLPNAASLVSLLSWLDGPGGAAIKRVENILGTLLCVLSLPCLFAQNMVLQY